MTQPSIEGRIIIQTLRNAQRPVKVSGCKRVLSAAMLALTSALTSALMLPGIFSAPAFASLDESIIDTGKGRMSHGDWDGAVESFNEAIGLTAGSSNLYFLRGQSFFHMKDYDRALGDFDHAIQLDASNSDALTWRGTTQSKLGHDDLAIRDFAQAIRVNPQLAKNYFQARPRATETLHVQTVHGGGGGNVPYQPYNASNGLTRPVAARGQDEHTVGLYKEAMSRVYPDGLNGSAKLPEDTSSTVSTATTSTTSTTATTETVDKLASDSTGDKTSRKRHEKSAKELEDMQKNAARDKARKEVADYSEAIRRDGSSAADYFHRGRAYQRLDNFDSAVADFSSAISLSPQNSQFYLARASVYVLMKKPLMAKADVENARSVDPTVPDKVELNLER
ncbi:MAG: tetratricopeptide repeat protein [Candidatus Obscuribacterales bacterium]|nr:tetratricopeptide repeat protein [Candidatus Obscuribacterales bacterium]